MRVWCSSLTLHRTVLLVVLGRAVIDRRLPEVASAGIARGVSLFENTDTHTLLTTELTCTKLKTRPDDDHGAFILAV